MARKLRATLKRKVGKRVLKKGVTRFRNKKAKLKAKRKNIVRKMRTRIAKRKSTRKVA